MTEIDLTAVPSAEEHYWTVLPKYIAALNHAIDISHRTAGLPAEPARRYWASVIFTRLCCAGTSVLHLCPGSPSNSVGALWDFTSVAALVRSLIQTCSLHFYLGTELVEEDESRARVLIMQLRDCVERLHFFQSAGASSEKIRGFEAAAEDLRGRISSNKYFVRLPGKVRRRLQKGATDSILTQDQILGRMGLLDQAGRAFLAFISSHADVSPFAYFLTGENNRGRGEENDTDKHYIATAVDLACDFILRASADMETLFREAPDVGVQQPTSKSDERAKHAIEHVLQWQGVNIEELIGGDESGAPLICSDCFQDEGLRLSSARIGQKDMSKCPNCGSQIGVKLNKRSVANLAQQFFVWGTIRRGKYGASPSVQLNKHQITSIDVAPWLGQDLRLIEQVLAVGFFYYGPRLWMIGEVEPLKALRDVESRGQLISRILNEYPTRILDIDEYFYRMRKDPTNPGGFDQYDAPPGEKLGQGRFETSGLPILYGSQDLEVCLHECRVAADDELYVATLAPLRKLKLLNLAEMLPEQNVTEFESLDMAIHMLFLAGQHSYEISREIACAAHKHGFDGIVYPSYFTLLRTGGVPFETAYGISLRRIPELRELTRKRTISNLALFGRPIAEGLVTVKCINRVLLNKVEYTLHFGPLLAREHGPNSFDPADPGDVIRIMGERAAAIWNRK